MTELFFWRQRMAKFNSVTQQVPFLNVFVVLRCHVLFCPDIPIKGCVSCVVCAAVNSGPLHCQIRLDCRSQRYVQHTRLGSLALRHWTLCLTHGTCQHSTGAHLYSSFRQRLHLISSIVLQLACSSRCLNWPGHYLISKCVLIMEHCTLSGPNVVRLCSSKQRSVGWFWVFAMLPRLQSTRYGRNLT